MPDDICIIISEYSTLEETGTLKTIDPPLCKGQCHCQCRCSSMSHCMYTVFLEVYMKRKRSQLCVRCMLFRNREFPACPSILPLIVIILRVSSSQSQQTLSESQFHPGQFSGLSRYHSNSQTLKELPCYFLFAVPCFFWCISQYEYPV